MAIIVVGKEKDLAAVAARVLTARASKTAHADAIAALRTANPGIEEAHLRPGTVLVVPDVEGGRVNVDGAHQGSTAELTDRVRGALEDLAAAFERHTAEDADARERSARTLAAADLKRVATRDPQLRARLAELNKTLKADAKTADGEAEQWRESIESWTGALDAIRPLDH
jgi:hypothetical protein